MEKIMKIHRGPSKGDTAIIGACERPKELSIAQEERGITPELDEMCKEWLERNFGFQCASITASEVLGRSKTDMWLGIVGVRFCFRDGKKEGDGVAFLDVAKVWVAPMDAQ